MKKGINLYSRPKRATKILKELGLTEIYNDKKKNETDRYMIIKIALKEK